MIQKRWIALILIGVIVGPLTVYGIEQYLHSHTITISSGVHEYLESELLAEDALIPWGIQPPGSYYYNYTVYNNTTYSLIATITISGLPVGWTLTWTNQTHNLDGITILPYTLAIGNLTLTIPLGTQEAQYTWTHTLGIEEATP